LPRRAYALLAMTKWAVVIASPPLVIASRL